MEENTEKKEKKQIKISLGTAICIFIIILLVAVLAVTVVYYNSAQEKNNIAEENNIEVNTMETGRYIFNVPKVLKEKFGHYYDDISIEIIDSKNYNFHLEEGFYIKGKYTIDNATLICKADVLGGEYSEEEEIEFECVFKINDNKNIELTKIEGELYASEILKIGNTFTLREENRDEIESETNNSINQSTEAGSFVEYNGELYFWKLSSDSKEEISLGQFYYVPGSENDLVKLDKEGNEKIIYTGEGTGKILIVNDKIYSSYGKDENDEYGMIYSIDMNGENKVEYKSGEIKTNIGNYIICQTDLGGDIFRINTITNEVEVLKENANFLKCIDEKIYYYEPYDSEEEILKIGTITDDSDNGIVATITNDEFGELADGNKLEVLLIRKENDEVRIHVGYRSGSARYVQHVKAIVLGKEGKAKKEDVEYSIESMDYREITEIINDANVICVDGLEYINKETNQEVQIMTKDELNKEFGFVSDSEHSINVYDYTVIGRDIYIVLDYGEHYPEEDIGWRYAYKRLKTVCFKYNIDTDEITELYSF